MTADEDDVAPADRQRPAPPGEGRRVLSARRLFVTGAAAVPIVLVAVLAIGMATGVGQDPTGEVDASFRVAPDFALAAFNGDVFTLSEHADGPVFLYFWASWCAPCREEAPLIEALWPEYRRRGYTFVGVNILDSESDARAFVDRFGLTFPNMRDPEGDVYLEYGVYGLPESFFLRSGLEVRTKFLGALTEEALRDELEALDGE